MWYSLFSFCNAPPTPDIVTLSLHDALPISRQHVDRRQLLGEHERVSLRQDDDTRAEPDRPRVRGEERERDGLVDRDRKSTRLNSSHTVISYAVFCLKKKTKKNIQKTLHKST